MPLRRRHTSLQGFVPDTGCGVGGLACTGSRVWCTGVFGAPLLFLIMVETEEAKQCKNCERQIEASKFRMHEMQCARINYKCQDCGQVVAKADKAEHEAEAHVPVVCQHCQFTAGKVAFGTHEERCEMRPQACPYCQQMFKIQRYGDHVDACAVKTTKCSACDRFVKNKDLAKHPEQECRKNQAENEAQKAAQKQLEQQKIMEELAKFQEQERIQMEKKKTELITAQKRKAEEERRKAEEDKVRQQIAAKAQKPIASMLAQPPTAKPTLNQNLQPTNQSSRPTVGRPTQQPQMQPVPQPKPTMQTNPYPKPTMQPTTQPKPTMVQPQPVRKPEASQVQTQVKRPEPKKPVADEQNLDEVSAALIAQLMEEDESAMLAERLQNQGFGGQSSNNQAFMQPQAHVRQADQQRMGRLDDFDDDFTQPIRQPRRQPARQPAREDWGNQTSDDLQAALQASMEQHNLLSREEAELARVLELSRQHK